MRILAVTNLYPSAKRPSMGVFVEQQVKGLREIGLDVHVLFIDRVEQGMRSYFKMRPLLEQAATEFRPDLMHVMYGGVMAERCTAWRYPLPRIVTFHGSDLLGENLSGLMRKAVSHFGIFCSRLAARRADHVIIVSQRLRQALPRKLPSEKISIIPCGIDFQRFKPMGKRECQDHLKWAPDSFHVLFPANNGDPVKRPALAAAAIERLNQAGVPTVLHYLKGVPNTAVPQLINASDALILTSAHEGSPTVVKEALACDVPVVSVDVGDVRERIAGIDGCYLAEATPEDLAAKLRLVQQRKARVDSRSKILSLSIQNTARTLESLYRATLTRGVHAPERSLAAAL